MKTKLTKSLVFIGSILIASFSWAERNTDIKVVIEEPAVGENYSGITNLRGWAVAPEGMTKYYLNVYIDGEFAFYMPHGAARGDVGGAYPDYPNSDRSGYSMAFNYKNLTPGEHTIEVVGYDDNGDYNVASATFNAERFSTEYIGDSSDVNLNTAVDISLLDQHTILVTGASFEDKQWDFTLKWDQASQSFKTEGILPSSGGSAGGTPPPAHEDIYACITAPDSFYDSYDDVIRMRNGLEANNYKGDYWFSDDEHVVFETASGDWYTIKNEEELIRLDVIAEPTSCFDAEYLTVRDTRTDAGAKVLLFDEGEISVSSSCPIGTGAKLSAYRDYNGAYLVDLLYARQCEFFQVTEY